jgi:thioredoxin reductase
VLVLGGGPAALSCAIRCARYGLETALVADPSDFHRAWAGKVHRLLAFPDGVSGRALLERSLLQAEREGIRIVEGRAIALRAAGPERFEAEVCAGGEDGPSHTEGTRFVVLGDDVPEAPEPLLALLAETHLAPAEAVAFDAADFIGRQVVVVAEAPEAAGTIAAVARLAEVAVAIVPDAGRIEPAVRSGLDGLGVEVKDSQVAAVRAGDGKLRALVLETGEEIRCELVYPVRADTPAARLARSLGLTTKAGYVEVDPRRRTRIDGCYAVGNPAPGRDAAVAAESDGWLAATDMALRLRAAAAAAES